MNANKQAIKTNTVKKPKKTPLDNFQLFYEEIPLGVKSAEAQPTIKSKDRLTRRSRQ